MLQALFGLPDIALRTMEVYTTGTLDAWLIPARDACGRSGGSAWSGLSADARATYRGSCTSDPAFLDYFHASTPEAEIGD